MGSDQMPADDPRAIRTRRDLRRVNAYMRNVSCMASALRKHGAGRQPHTIVDLGSGDGQFMLRVARRLAPHWRNIKVILQDRQNIVSDATREGFAALQCARKRLAPMFSIFSPTRDPRTSTSSPPICSCITLPMNNWLACSQRRRSLLGSWWPANHGAPSSWSAPADCCGRSDAAT